MQNIILEGKEVEGVVALGRPVVTRVGGPGEVYLPVVLI
jgi:hypothetical protein